MPEVAILNMLSAKNAQSEQQGPHSVSAFGHCDFGSEDLFRDVDSSPVARTPLGVNHQSLTLALYLQPCNPALPITQLGAIVAPFKSNEFGDVGTGRG